VVDECHSSRRPDVVLLDVNWAAQLAPVLRAEFAGPVYGL
jgi:hypothetical protein